MKYLFSFILSFMLAGAYGQHGAEFGLKAGVNVANFKIGDGNGDARIGLHAGGLLHIHLDEHFALQPEFVFSAQGSEYGNNRRDKFSYLNIPVLIQYMFNNGFRLQTGPQLGVLLDAKAEIGDNEVDVEGFKTLDAAWAFGAGFLTRSGFGFDARYNLGITSVRTEKPAVKNAVWQFGVFYQFRKR